MMKQLIRVGLFAAMIAVSGYFSSANAQSVSGSIANGTVTRGTAAKATIVLSLPGGLHANSSRPGGEYAVPTTVRATSSGGVKIGSVSYPAGRNRKFEFSDKPLNVYEGRVTFRFNVTAPATFRGRNISVKVNVRYQACTNEVCYAPKTKTLTLTARVN
ncbi:MAG: protein-disulfide reductase DsbD N-terminal domain-containing protein [Pyrinomonadaceae bacterium]